MHTSGIALFVLAVCSYFMLMKMKKVMEENTLCCRRLQQRLSARACRLGDWDKELCVRLLAQWKDREQNSPLSNIMGFSAHPSAENTITDPLRVAFSDFSLKCFLLCSPRIPVARFKPNRHPFTQTCPHITAQHARLEGWGWQASIRPSTLM